MSDLAPEPPVPELDEAQAEIAALRQALLLAESRLLTIRQSENHERVLRIDAEARCAAPPDALDRVAVLQAAVEARDAALDGLRAQLGAIENSVVWRASWPLRRMLDRHPRLARMGRRAAKAGWWTLTGQWKKRLAARRDWHALQAAQGSAAPAAGPLLPPGGPAVRAPALPAPARLDPPLDLPTSDTPSVSVIVPCFGQVPVTLRCLRAIAAAETLTPFEVIVAEDASGDPAIDLLAQVGGLRLLRNARNLGFLHNCNEAALSARGRYLLFLNNDTEPMPGFLDALVRAIEAVPRAGLVGAKLLFPDGRLQEAGGIIWQDGTGWNYGRNDDANRPEYATLRDTDYVSGAAMLLRRDLFEALDGFDPVFAPAYYEDTDLAFRIRARGLRVLVQPSSLVIHHEGVSHGTDITAGIKQNQEVNRHRFLSRWPKLLASEHFPSGQQPMRAAEHARHAFTILVIDHYVPEPDRDAGSRSTLAILRALRDAGWVVRFWPANRQRNEYTPILETMGIVVLDHRLPLGFDEWIGREGHQFDHALVMRPAVAPEFLSGLMTRTTARLSFYGHDIHHLRMRRQAALTDDAALSREADAMERREHALWALFDTVIYPSAVEAERVRAAVPQARARAIVPFAFDRAPARPAPPPGRTVLFVAGFAHPPNIDAACWLAADILPRLRRIVPDASLVLAGSHPTRAVQALAGDGITVTGALSEDALRAQYREARAAVVPLRAGAGVKGKVVEALAHGLPLVTTPIGAEGIAELESVASVSDDPDRIADALAALLTDDRLWRERSGAQQALAARCFSQQALSDSVLRALLDPPDA
ncbi:glycosyltransferase [Acetobacteraceae bacterium KSS8]|uniref:Glycosyltransferase n=1 Tax=Endosaccharibacter trunci TaxID=2812733 RepID=A0ABT1W6S4_9PROT|nr:glycosyltransferase [Acetobacteraceae bacterium KSS8]